MKRKRIILVIIITISMILLSSILFIVISNHYKNLNNNEDNEIKEDNNIENNQDNNESNNSELTNYKVDLENYYMKTNEQIKFYSNQQLVNEYKCTGKECYIVPLKVKCVYENGRSDCKTIVGDYVLIAVNDKNDGTSIFTYGSSTSFQKTAENIKSSGKVFLYNIKTGESKKYENIYEIMPNQDGLRLLEYADGEYTIISDDGKVSSNYNKDELTLSCYEGCALDATRYDYDENIIVTIKDKKYGLEKITNKDIIVEHKYEDIQLNDSQAVRLYDNEEDQMGHLNNELYRNKYIKVKENGKWYLYDLKNNKKINNNGYDKLYLIDENTMIVMEDNYFYIKDYNNNLLTNEKIYVENLLPIMPKIGEGIKIIKTGDNCAITITDGPNMGDYKTYEYNYNLKTKELKKVTGE